MIRPEMAATVVAVKSTFTHGDEMSKRLAMLDANGVVINVAMFEDSVEPDGVTTAVPSRTTRVGDRLVGGVFTPSPKSVPTTVTKLQLVRAMRSTGLWSTFKSSLKQSPTEIKEDWDYASVMDRDDELVMAFGVTLELDTAGMDALFIEASTL